MPQLTKKMKHYINIFYLILSKIEPWETININEKKEIFSDYLNLNKESSYIVEYFEKYRIYLKKSTFNSLIKSVNKLNF